MHWIAEVPSFAIGNLKRQGVRSYLTLIGIIIGITAIITIISLGNGLNNAINEEFEKIGTNSIYILPGSASSSFSLSGSKEISDSQLKKIESIPEVTETLAPVFSFATVEYKRQKQKAPIMGLSMKDAETFLKVGFAEIGAGRSIKETDFFVAVVGADVGSQYFDKEIRLRDRLIIEGKSFRVIGITKKSSQIAGDPVSTNNAIFIPEKAYKQIFEKNNPIYAIVKTASSEEVESVKKKIERIFERDFGKDQKEFTVQTSQQLMDQVNQIMGIISLFLVGIAAISLLVGSIGIMNTMIMAVMERTKEIGLMKAIGATNNLVLTMFMLEAGFIGALGGFIGTVIGYSLAFITQIASTSLGFALAVQFDLMLVLGALAFAMLVGIISGFYPALRAARLDPVQALRGFE